VGGPRAGLLRWSTLRAVVLIAASVLLLVRGGMFWVDLIGGGPQEFSALALDRKMFVGSLAVLCVIAGVGVWFRSLWGVATWILCLGLEAAASIDAAQDAAGAALTAVLLQNGVLVASAALLLLFIATAVASMFE
jgi:hypothetical protein